MPNPIHAMGRAIAKISELRVPASPKVTFNVGVVSGGTSVNSISATGVMDIDMRSESASELAKIDTEISRAIQAALAEENDRWLKTDGGTTASRYADARLTVTVDTIGIRPTGAQSDDALIVRTAVEAGKLLGFSEPTGASSTDANLPISMGIPAITIDGGGRGRGSHSLDEEYDDGDRGYLGPQWALLIIAALAKVR
jgi:acetylornithine deacetylase/succinyl-diaminopimelate desuccinylase-like protein